MSRCVKDSLKLMHNPPDEMVTFSNPPADSSMALLSTPVLTVFWWIQPFSLTSWLNVSSTVSFFWLFSHSVTWRVRKKYPSSKIFRFPLEPVISFSLGFAAIHSISVWSAETRKLFFTYWLYDSLFQNPDDSFLVGLDNNLHTWEARIASPLEGEHHSFS